MYALLADATCPRRPLNLDVTTPDGWLPEAVDQAPGRGLPVQVPSDDRYVVERFVGEGGGGHVWLAWDRRACRPVALKCLHVRYHDDAVARARFTQEAALTSALVHAGVVRVYDSGLLTDGTPFYAQRFVEGRSLADALNDRAERGAVGVAFDLLHRFARLCWTVAYAHEQGVVHLDIKPSNIVLDHGRGVYLVDWGIARRLADPAPQAASLYGTLGYMAPECLRQGTGAGTPAADVYGLGITLYEILTGQRPFQARNELMYAVKACHEVAPDPRTMAPGVPDALAQLCNLALKTEPEARALTAAGMGEAIEAWLTGREGQRGGGRVTRHRR